MDQVYRPLGSGDLRVIESIAIQVAVDLLLYGVQITLSIAAITILARRLEHKRSRLTLMALLGLLSASTINTVVHKIYYLAQFPVNIGTSERSVDMLLYRLSILDSVSRDLSYVLSDAVLVWRAWGLWPDRFLAKCILSICMCGTVVGSIAEMAWTYWPSLYDISINESIGEFLTRFIPLLATNVVATVLIGQKVMQYRLEIKGSLGLFMPKSKAEVVLMLLLESGLAYIIFWACLFRQLFASSAILNIVSLHIAGIYPTCVLFAVARGTTESLLSGQVSQAMRFGDPPAAHPGARVANMANMTLDFHLEDSVGALDSVAQDSRTDKLPGPSGTHRGESIPASSAGIVEVERESTAI
ncbi:hypothetical protein K523DRAFT_419636 [Schizophyllum commune Tattone D]|nr:hypothetical protein K523DRAFT_419636 [Schizophyllum commune Tattone D]